VHFASGRGAARGEGTHAAHLPEPHVTPEIVKTAPYSHVPAAAARAVADFFARYLPAAGAPPPDAEAVAAIVDTAFWASLLREEGRSPRISLALVPPELAGEPLQFEHPFPLAPAPLARLAPAVERPGIHLGVWRHGSEMCVWGATRVLPDLCLVLEVVEPGLLVLKYRRAEEFGKYGNIAVLRGNRMDVLDQVSTCLPGCDGEGDVPAGLRLDSRASRVELRPELVQLAISMREHGRGGSLLVVPAGADEWRESIVKPVPYAVAPSFSTLAGLLDAVPPEPEHGAWQEDVRHLVDAVAGLTAVDGAAVMTDDYAILAFGAKIMRRDGFAAVERITVTEPVLGNVPQVVAPSQLGGTRHLSAAQFVSDQRDALALVASQDGRFTVFAWSPAEDMVHAHRMEALLL
jgi:hypothetical protein